MFTPNLASTSDDPAFEETALLPCFATLTPQAAVKIAVAVDTLRVSFPSPPVPHVSSKFIPAFSFFDFCS